MIMSIDWDAFHDHYVSQGIAVLDSFRPDWRSKINLETLDMWSAFDCILGQVFAEEREAAYAAWLAAMEAWNRDQVGQRGEEPRYVLAPYHYGRDLLIIATGGTLISGDYASRAQWAADHGFLVEKDVDSSAFSDDPEVTSNWLLGPDLRNAWTRALTVAS
jgi:hypothetical protein